MAAGSQGNPGQGVKMELVSCIIFPTAGLDSARPSGQAWRPRGVEPCCREDDPAWAEIIMIVFAGVKKYLFIGFSGSFIS